MKNLYIILYLTLISRIVFSQENAISTRYDTSLGTNFDIVLWGGEPGWNLDIKGLEAKGTLPYGKDSLKSFILYDRVHTPGFTIAFSDTYIFKSTIRETLTITLINNSECPCLLDEGEGETNVSAYIHVNFHSMYYTFLGCAKIRKRP